MRLRAAGEQGKSMTDPKLFVSIHQDVTLMPSDGYPVEQFSPQISRLKCELLSAFAHRLPVNEPVHFLFVDIWMIDKDLPPHDIVYRRRKREISVRVGVDFRRFSVPPTIEDFDRIRDVADGALEAVVLHLERSTHSSARRDQGCECQLVWECAEDFGTDAELHRRRQIQDMLDAVLMERGLGSVSGGSIGSGEMEVHVSLTNRRSATRIIGDLVRTLGLPTPKRIELL